MFYCGICSFSRSFDLVTGSGFFLLVVLTVDFAEGSVPIKCFRDSVFLILKCSLLACVCASRLGFWSC